MAADHSCAYEPSGDVPLLEPRQAPTYGTPAQLKLAWSPDALARLERIPSFVRGVVSARIESFARDRGDTRITAETMAEVRGNMPIDFSKRLPFFAGTESDSPG
jgi:hypothetical protein